MGPLKRYKYPLERLKCTSLTLTFPLLCFKVLRAWPELTNPDIKPIKPYGSLNFFHINDTNMNTSQVRDRNPIAQKPRRALQVDFNIFHNL